MSVQIYFEKEKPGHIFLAPLTKVCLRPKMFWAQIFRRHFIKKLCIYHSRQKMEFLRMLCKIKQAPIRTQFLACPNTSLGESIFSMIIWQYSSEAHNHKPGIYWDFLGMHIQSWNLSNLFWEWGLYWDRLNIIQARPHWDFLLFIDSVATSWRLFTTHIWYW